MKSITLPRLMILVSEVTLTCYEWSDARSAVAEVHELLCLSKSDYPKRAKVNRPGRSAVLEAWSEELSMREVRETLNRVKTAVSTKSPVQAFHALRRLFKMKPVEVKKSK